MKDRGELLKLHCELEKRKRDLEGWLLKTVYDLASLSDRRDLLGRHSEKLTEEALREISEPLESERKLLESRRAIYQHQLLHAIYQLKAVDGYLLELGEETK